VKAFPPEVARDALGRWPSGAAAAGDTLARIATSGNDVWRFDAPVGTPGGPAPRILRLTDRAWRTPEENAAECAFLVHAAATGAHVNEPVPSTRGALVEELPAVHASASVFTWADGDFIARDDPRADATFYRAWGGALAALHDAAATYDGPARWEWKDEGLLAGADGLLPAGDAAIRDRRDELYARLEALPRTRATFGPIHADFAPQNFRYREGRVTAFDFGNLCRHWFVQDLVVSFSTLRRDPARDRLRDAILAGYRAVRPLDDAAWAERDTFLRLRVLYVYLSRLARFGPVPSAEERAVLADLRGLVLARVSWP
jgi:Ser/Thr protein kinase RdoA (MazF antagonist)